MSDLSEPKGGMAQDNDYLSVLIRENVELQARIDQLEAEIAAIAQCVEIWDGSTLHAVAERLRAILAGGSS